jgi:crotonobetainyl-CoA:carnitine CoA-transferase CaiB-like acyl-CoA transferase
VEGRRPQGPRASVFWANGPYGSGADERTVPTTSTPTSEAGLLTCMRERLLQVSATWPSRRPTVRSAPVQFGFGELAHGPAPTPGQHNVEILRELGFNSEQIAGFQRLDIIAEGLQN